MCFMSLKIWWWGNFPRIPSAVAQIGAEEVSERMGRLGRWGFIKCPCVVWVMAWEGVKYTLKPLHTGKLTSAGTLNLEGVFFWRCLFLPMLVCVFFLCSLWRDQWCVALYSLPGPPAMPWRQGDLILAIWFNHQNVWQEPRGPLVLEDL